MEEVSEKVENVKVRMCDNVFPNLKRQQNDDSIPIRSNKKTGAKSKKEIREQVLFDCCLLHSARRTVSLLDTGRGNRKT